LQCLAPALLVVMSCAKLPNGCEELAALEHATRPLGRRALRLAEGGELLARELLLVVRVAQHLAVNVDAPLTVGGDACGSNVHAGQLLASWSVAPRVRQHSRGIFSCLPIVAYRVSFTEPRGS